MILGQRLDARANRELKTCGTIDKLRRKLEESEDTDLGKIGFKVQRMLFFAKENAPR